MSQLLKYRENLNLTQEQLSAKANISVRTIQRIEAGGIPKGHTLEALSKALGIDKEALIATDPEQAKHNWSLIKLINLSSLALILVPLGSILLPLTIMYLKKEINSLTKQIVSIQILWTLLFPLITLTAIFLGKWFSLSNQIVPLTMLLLVLVNAFVIIRNTIELDSNRKLYIHMNFNIF